MMRFFTVCLLAVLVTGCSQAKNDASPEQCLEVTATDMVWVSGGAFVMGEQARYREEGPPRTAQVKGFWIDTHEVTNAQFAAFIKETGYKTLAERAPPQIAGAPPEMLQPGSAVFNIPSDDDPRWWRWVVGAQWRHPSGPDETLSGKDNIPVVQLAYDDALAYAKGAGKALLTEWEYAARGGLDGATYAWGEEREPGGDYLANNWQGFFPFNDDGSDGFVGRAPVGCYPPNGYGLYDMIGNVWEWTADPYAPPDTSIGLMKGGSYLCAPNYCRRYRPAARHPQEIDLGTDHIGFRTVSATSP